MAKKKSTKKKKRAPKMLPSARAAVEAGFFFDEPSSNTYQLDMSQPILAVAQDFGSNDPTGNPRLVDLRDGWNGPALTPRHALELRMAAIPFVPRDLTYADAARRDPVSNFFFD